MGVVEVYKVVWVHRLPYYAGNTDSRTDLFFEVVQVG